MLHESMMPLTAGETKESTNPPLHCDAVMTFDFVRHCECFQQTQWLPTCITSFSFSFFYNRNVICFIVITYILCYRASYQFGWSPLICCLHEL